MTAWIYLGLVLAAGAGMVATYAEGYSNGKQTVYLEKANLEAMALRAAAAQNEEVMNAVNEAVAKIRIEQKTYVQKFKEFERESVVYRECQHSDDAFRLLNAALRGDPVPSQPGVQTDVSEGSR